jgi:hypothetical protein
MKEKIYTIPLNDAFDADSECPFCFLHQKLEQNKLEYFLGAAMMEPDVRIMTNSKGFCTHHLHKMEQMPNTLSLALTIDTHVNQVIKRLKNMEDSIASLDSKKGIFKKETDFSKTKEQLYSLLDQTTQSCAVCDAIDETMNRYIDTFFYLYRTENEFKEKFQNSKGFCLSHFTHLVKSCDGPLTKAESTAFLKSLYTLELTHLSRINDEINYYTKKFDYQYQNADWKNSKDAPKRTIEKLVGHE